MLISATSPASITAASAACSARWWAFGSPVWATSSIGASAFLRIVARPLEAPTPSTAVWDHDLEHADAVEASRERLTDAPDRLLQPAAFPAQVVEPRLELARHRIELLAERGELVVALGGDGDG